MPGVISQAAFSALKTIVDERRIGTGESVRQLHARDESYHDPVLPQVVVWPHTTEEVSSLVRWAWDHGVSVTPWGAGTSLEGNPIPVSGGMVVDFQEMNRILAVKKGRFSGRCPGRCHIQRIESSPEP